MRDVEPIGSTADYLNAYPVFTNYPNHEPLHLYKTEACMQSVAAIRKVCEENGVNLIVLTAPVYTDYYKNFLRRGYHEFLRISCQSDRLLGFFVLVCQQ